MAVNFCILNAGYPFRQGQSNSYCGTRSKLSTSKVVAAQSYCDEYHTRLGARVAGTEMQGAMILGEYEIIRHIGGGGMAQVYLAKSTSEGTKVAVKIMNTEHVRKQKSLERFRREARLICKLKHPNLVQGIALGEYESRPLIVMEYVEGPDIAGLIEKRGKLNPNESLKLLLDVSLALNHLFIEGSIQAHRDIKPHNILVSPGGVAKLTDFGIAKALDEVESMTMTSSFLGSPHYMSPEQINDPRNADIRSDIYALGAVFYEMLTGEKAFPGHGTKQILDAHFELEAPTLAGAGELVDSCNVILASTMAFEPSARYQSPRQLVDHLVPLVDADITVTVPRFARSSVRFAVAASVVGIVAAIAIGGVLSLSAKPAPAATPNITQAENSGGTAVDPATPAPASEPTTLSSTPRELPDAGKAAPKGTTSSVGGAASKGISADALHKKIIGGQ